MKTKGAGTTFQPSSVLEPDSNPPVHRIALSPALFDCTSTSSITLIAQITPHDSEKDQDSSDLADLEIENDALLLLLYCLFIFYWGLNGHYFFGNSILNFYLRGSAKIELP